MKTARERHSPTAQRNGSFGRPMLRAAVDGWRKRGAAALPNDAAVIVEGDCVQLLNELPSGCTQLVFADPPYNLSHGGTTVKSGKRVSVDKGSWDSWQCQQDFLAFNRRWLHACQRVLSPSGTIWVSASRHNLFSVGYAMQTSGWHLLNLIAWFKPNAAPNLGCRTFTESCEHLIWAAPKKMSPLAHHFNYDALRTSNDGVQARDFWEIPTPALSEKAHGRHPAQKPLALLRRVMLASARPGDLVIDPFAGSHTTGVEAVRAGCNYIGIELDPKYNALGLKRLYSAAPLEIR